MRPVVLAIIAAFAGASAATAAVAEEKPVELKPAPGRDTVEGNCAACHSLDYIPMNSRFLAATGWQAEVSKMIKAFGAPISAADAKIISDYLTKNYGQ